MIMQYQIFSEVHLALCLIEDDEEWCRAMQEAISGMMPWVFNNYLCDFLYIVSLYIQIRCGKILNMHYQKISYTVMYDFGLSENIT